MGKDKLLEKLWNEASKMTFEQRSVLVQTYRAQDKHHEADMIEKWFQYRIKDLRKVVREVVFGDDTVMASHGN